MSMVVRSKALDNISMRNIQYIRQMNISTGLLKFVKPVTFDLL